MVTPESAEDQERLAIVQHGDRMAEQRIAFEDQVRLTSTDHRPIRHPSAGVQNSSATQLPVRLCSPVLDVTGDFALILAQGDRLSLLHR